MLELIISIIIAAAPALTSIFGIIAAVIKNKKNVDASLGNLSAEFEALRKQVFDTKEYEALKNQLLIAHQENCELKKYIKELLTKIDHIEREV